MSANRFHREDGSVNVPAVIAASLNAGKVVEFNARLVFGIRPKENHVYTASEIEAEFRSTLRQQFKRMRTGFPPIAAFRMFDPTANPEDN